jgi:uncharacterized protein (DUF302 family)
VPLPAHAGAAREEPSHFQGMPHGGIAERLGLDRRLLAVNGRPSTPGADPGRNPRRYFTVTRLKRPPSASSTSPDAGVVSLPSRRRTEETARRLEQELAALGMRIFAHIDQQAAAKQAGLEMRPMVLILFGNPKAGTPLMLAHPSLAIDLPLKALVWEDPEGQTWLSYNSPEYLRLRHGLAEAPFGGLEAIFARALE